MLKTCNTPKTPKTHHTLYMCSTLGNVDDFFFFWQNVPSLQTKINQLSLADVLGDCNICTGYTWYKYQQGSYLIYSHQVPFYSFIAVVVRVVKTLVCLSQTNECMETIHKLGTSQ